MKKFNSSFLLGAATAAHQVEGNNIYSDCWAQEQMKHSAFVEPSGNCCGHYEHYTEDIQMLAQAGLNAYRFSIEWARVEPEEGQFCEEAIDHYRDVIACCVANGVEPVVTLHHFSSPKWLITKGGWEADTVVEDFARYVRYVMEHLGADLYYVCTINEANMGIALAGFAEQFIRQLQAQTAGNAEGGVQVGINIEELLAGQKEAARETLEVFGVDNPQTFLSPRTQHGDELIMQAHQAAVKVIREVAPHVKVGLTLSLHDIQAAPGGEGNAAREWDKEFLHYLPAIAGDDFIGVQNYTRSLIGPEGTLPEPEGAEMTQSGYAFYPQALEHVIRAVYKDFHGDILVTENGIGTADDSRRVAFIQAATDGVCRCLADGLPVKGYFHWSLLDNFEWQKGFSITFGLVAVDRKTQKRMPKESLSVLGSLR
ncbi:MAG: family 1 glycosylhydrolase [Clostridiales bacterium]|nr:family 1 glycosylhydrolase [Clostridiales bacterium]